MTYRKTPELKQLFVDRMKLLLNGKDFEEYLKILNQEPVKSIRCNTLKISPEELKKRLEEKKWKIFQPWKSNPEMMIVEGKYIRQGSQIDVATHSTLSECSAEKIINAEKKFKSDEINCNNLKENLNNNQRDLVGNKKNYLWHTNSSAKKSDEVDFEANQFRDSVEQIIPLEPGELGRVLEHLLGYYYIQELASMLPIIALNPKPNEIVLDLCASPGSKTTQASALMKNSGLIIANEISMGRIKILSSNLERCGVANAIVTKKDGAAMCERLKKFYPELKFDKILIDAPCSGEGTLRSSLKTYEMWNINTIKQLSGLQKKLIATAVDLLKVGGEMIYSTCTHAPEENEEVADFVLKNFPEMKIQKISIPVKCREGITKWNEKKYSKEVKQSCRIYPQDNNTGGFFLVKFKKITATQHREEERNGIYRRQRKDIALQQFGEGASNFTSVASTICLSGVARRGKSRGFLAILNEYEKKQIENKLNKQFGIKKISGKIIQTKTNRLYLFEGNLSEKQIQKIESILPIEKIGVYFATIIPGENRIRLSIEGTHIFKEQITKNIFNLDEKQTEEWMKGRELNIKTGKKEFLIMKYKEDFLGTGKASELKINNFIPKSRRLKEKNS